MAQLNSLTPPVSHSCPGHPPRQAHDATAMFCRNAFRLYISAIVGAPRGPFRPGPSRPIRASAKEPAPRAFPMFFSSQSRLITNSGRFGSSRNASSAHTVGTISGSPATPYTIGFPQFQPPPGHMRSYSIRRARSRRCAAPSGKISTGADASKISANEVGSTQLLVCGVHPQPRYESFCSLIFRWENKRARQRRHVALSRGQSLQIHFPPAATASRARASAASTQQASAVTQDPLSSADDGQEPLASCVLRKNSRPRAGISPEGAPLSCARNARIAQQVGSTRLPKPGWNPQPPSEFCAARISGKQKFAANTDSLERFCESRLSPAGFILIGLIGPL